MSRLSYLLCLQAMLFLGACGLFPEEEGTDTASLSDEDVERLFEVALVSETEPSAARLEDILGRAEETYAEAVENRHRPGQTDTLRTLYYDGLEIHLYETHPPEAENGPERSLMTELVVDGAGHPTPIGVQVGDSRDRVLDLLGEPDEKQEAVWIYELGEVTPTFLEISWEGEEVGRLEWNFYVD